MSSKKLVIVESPTKARTIKKFLPDCEIVASMGHIRDLPRSASEVPAAFKNKPWSSLGIDIDNDFNPLYILPKEKSAVVKSLADKIAKYKEIYLATDEDREGESISWHIIEVLKPKTKARRMVFNEITKSAVLNALENPRTINMDLVRAQETRRILDRLVGYTVSPLLWKKIAPGLSAGRVQSVLVRLVVNREKERLAFVSNNYWDIVAIFEKGSQKFTAKLHSVASKTITQGKDFDPNTGKLLNPEKVLVLTKEKCEELQKSLLDQQFTISKIDERQTSKKPPLPFITSSLQQEGIRKLKLSAKNVMSVAQSLYEKGFITYMRTDSPVISSSAVKATRDYISKKFGAEYLNSAKKTKTSSIKNAQEAHEAIRPTGLEMLEPQKVKLSGVEAKLYTIIWQRTIASQMAPAKISQATVELTVKNCIFKAHGQEIKFPGFLKVYQEASDSSAAKADDMLPPLKLKEKLTPLELNNLEHNTEPKARFNEASLIKTMEKEGIGRPSTYATVIETIMLRGYIKKKRDAIFPTITAFTVVSLLESHLPDLVDLKFTAKMEENLDKIALGEVDRLKYLADFYQGKSGLKSTVTKMESSILPQTFRELTLQNIAITIKIGRYGPFVRFKHDGKEIAVKVPEDVPPADLTRDLLAEQAEFKAKDFTGIGVDPESGLPIYYLVGIYGPYLQVGDVPQNNQKPKRIGLPAEYGPADVSLDLALKLIKLPITIGKHPETGGIIKVNIGKLGPYLLHTVSGKKHFRSIDTVDAMFDLDLEAALKILSSDKFKKAAIKRIGLHPENQQPIEIFKGPYSLYLNWGKINVGLPKKMDIEKITLEMALEMITKKKNSPHRKKDKLKKLYSLK